MQQHTDKKGSANLQDMPLYVTIENGKLLQAQGGIALIDSAEFDELSITVSGVDVNHFQG